MNRGDVWWADLPGQGRRPVLVFSRQVAIPLLPNVVVVPATRTIRGIPSEVRIGPADGMPDECALSFDNVVTVPKVMLHSYVCTLGFEVMRKACQAWRDAAQC